jgi:predicted RNase H-like nuclease (RuvC/YqgF family)
MIVIISVSVSLILTISIIAMILWNKLKGVKQQVQDQKHLVQNLTAQNEGLNKQLEQFRDITSLEGELSRIQLEAEEELNKIQSEKERLVKDSTTLKSQIDILRNNLDVLEDQELLVAHGFYEHRYRFETTEKYSERLDAIQEEQKRLIKDGLAAVCGTEWTVNDSKTEGRKMTKNQIKIALRSFNGECDAAVAKVNYKNMYAMKNRIEKAYNDLNSLIMVNHIFITQQYLDLRLEELDLIQEYHEKKQEELEEQRHIREVMREEERVLREIEEAQREAEKEEDRYFKAIEKAKAEVEKLSGERQKQMLEKIQDLEEKLREAQEQKERAMSRAQMTRSGYVYVISNIGSFGEDVYKIGMTRRLEPMDRVKELGDASVPFRFDVHAMIYSENAPVLEYKLHRHFNEQRVNKINGRKEFFSVTLDDIEKAIEKYHGEIYFTKLAEAEEYRKTLAVDSSQSFIHQPPVETSQSILTA